MPDWLYCNIFVVVDLKGEKKKKGQRSTVQKGLGLTCPPSRVPNRQGRGRQQGITSKRTRHAFSQDWMWPLNTQPAACKISNHWEPVSSPEKGKNFTFLTKSVTVKVNIQVTFSKC